MHIYLLPRLLAAVPGGKELSALTLNTVCYAAAALLLFLCLRRFFRREFDALCDYGPGVLLEIAKHYGVLLLCNMALSVVLLLLGKMDNPNNEAIFSLAGEDLGMTTAVAARRRLRPAAAIQPRRGLRREHPALLGLSHLGLRRLRPDGLAVSAAVSARELPARADL